MSVALVDGPSAREAYVAARFDGLRGRFKDCVPADDPRLVAIRRALGPLDGLRVLDLGCGKGRFARRLADAGATVLGLDLSRGMLETAAGAGLPCLVASARRLPFSDRSFDAVIAVEVFEHLGAIGTALDEARRVLRPGGRLVLIDKNAGSLNARRPWLPNLAVKWLDERRGLWMYPARGPVRERWFWPPALRRAIAARFGSARVEFLLGPEESRWRLFRAVPAARVLTLWTAVAPGGPLA
ncbi:MAG: class I SAM-dependent methyltransferase, partial [Thermoleophilia bacterium]|nr:class I SAM-dependent methyltransferase [Thermoleophilia bacterium]